MMTFVAGASTLACGVIALFFLRFWTQTHDRLFAILALAFVVFGCNRAALTLLDEANADESRRTAVYLVRFLAFGLVALAVLDKNRPRPAERQPTPTAAPVTSGERSGAGQG
jgi:glucose uptake protein GlcU